MASRPRYTWSDLSPDERLVLPDVPSGVSFSFDHWIRILARVRERTPLTADGRRKDFGERRLRKTLRSLQEKNLVVERGRGHWILHIDGGALMDAADVNEGLRRRLT